MPREQRIRVLSAIAGCGLLVVAIVLVTFVTGAVPHDLVSVLSALTGWLYRDLVPEGLVYPQSPPETYTSPGA